MNKKRTLAVFLIGILALILTACGKMNATQQNTDNVQKLNQCAAIYEKYKDSGVKDTDESELKNILTATENFAAEYDQSWKYSDFYKFVNDSNTKHKDKAAKECKYEVLGIRLIALMKLGENEKYVSEFKDIYTANKDLGDFYKFEYNTIPKEKGTLSQDNIDLMFMGFDSIIENAESSEDKTQAAVSVQECCRYLEIECPQKYIQIVIEANS